MVVGLQNNMRLSKIYPKRNLWSHKGQFGYVLIVAGSNRYTGSPIFNAVAALRTGADLITIIAPQRAADVAAHFLPDLITIPLNGELTKKYLPLVLKTSKNFDALIIGGGLNRSEKTYTAIRAIIQTINLPMVIDAEAIRALAQNPKIIQNKKVIITPHKEEFRILTGEIVKDELSDRKKKVKKWAKQLGAVILLKGHFDVISDGQKVIMNQTGSPYLTKGGLGDTLAGICGALLARKINPLQAATIAAFINGKAGEQIAKKYGEGILTSDLFKIFPEIIKKFS